MIVETYRFGAIRECFEESGILLGASKRMDEASGTCLTPRGKQAGKAIHTNQVEVQGSGCRTMEARQILVCYHLSLISYRVLLMSHTC